MIRFIIFIVLATSAVLASGCGVEQEPVAESEAWCASALGVVWRAGNIGQGRATITAKFICDPVTQEYDWAMVGLTLNVDDGIERSAEVQYGCNDQVGGTGAYTIMTWDVPRGSTVTAWASAEDPVTGELFSCMSGAIPVAP